MKQESLVKQEHILEAAIRRFAHFGVAKTTMTEIAEDLAISKQALFYHVPDKQSLIQAIEEKIIGEYFSALETRFGAACDTEAALLSLIEMRSALYDKYSMLMIQGELMESAGSSTVAAAKQRARNKEIELVAGKLQQGMDKGELRRVDAQKTSSLVLEILAAFENCTLRRMAVPDPKNLQELFLKQKEVLHLVINGLKKGIWKN